MQLTLSGIDKRFGASHALNGVDFSLPTGEIRALIGENGAGKTTLMNVLGGVVQADKGTILVDGKPVQFRTPHDSLARGIAFIHQELGLINDLTVQENLFLGREKRLLTGLLDAKSMGEEAQTVLSRLDAPFTPSTLVRDLDATCKQMVEIARALLSNARLIIMDEPTTSLSATEIQRVFQLMRTLSKEGVSIVFISHKLREVLDVCDSYTVLRDGRVVRDGKTCDATEESLALAMVGHALTRQAHAQTQQEGTAILEGQNLSLQHAFHDISFAISPGEIVGFTGLLGDGRSALFRAIFTGERHMTGNLLWAGKPIRAQSTARMTRLGMGYVPPNRKENGIIADLSVMDNLSIVTLPQLRRYGLLSAVKTRTQADGLVKRLRVKVDSLDNPIGSLSGGNQQKIVLGKWLAQKPRVMVFDNPTQGVDVGAKEEIYDTIRALAGESMAVIVLSSEAAEIVRLADRALVLYHGTMQGELSGETLTEERIMLLATGTAMGKGAGT